MKSARSRVSLAPYLKTAAWSEAMITAPDADVILSARARLARNLEGYPFPGRASERDLRRVAQEVRRAALADTERLADLKAIEISALSPADRALLVDARRISPELADGGANRYALLDDNGALSIFIHEEDHVRIQALTAGNNPHAALASAEDAGNRLARRLRFAKHPRWEFLTASLNNVGTGLRISVLAHLPALAFIGRLPQTMEAVQSLEISIRGAHGERSSACGDLYQVSNTVTLGLLTEHIAGRVRPLGDYLVAAERSARREIADKSEWITQAIDRARLAWQTLEKADRLTAEDALDLLSALRLAAAAGLSPFGGHAPAPNAAMFANLVADLHTGGGLIASDGATSASAVRDAIQRPAKIRSALRPLYR